MFIMLCFTLVPLTLDASVAYHIHVDQATDGNCTATHGHLDPYERGDKPACDASQPQTCQVGDLSGKYGKITSDPFTAEYLDPFSSSIKDTDAYIGTRSFVIHYANGTRLTCADFDAIPLVHCPVTATPTPYTTECGEATPATSAPSYTSDCSDADEPISWQTIPSGTGVLPQPTNKPTSSVPVTAGAATPGIAGSIIAVVGFVMLAL